LGDLVMRMRGDAEEDVAQIGEGRDPDQPTALDERVQERGAAGALETASEEPVLASEPDGAQLPFGSGMPPAGLCRVRP
jgi:hypothetical protein